VQVETRRRRREEIGPRGNTACLFRSRELAPARIVGRYRLRVSETVQARRGARHPMETALRTIPKDASLSERRMLRGTDDKIEPRKQLGEVDEMLQKTLP